MLVVALLFGWLFLRFSFFDLSLLIISCWRFRSAWIALLPSSILLWMDSCDNVDVVAQLTAALIFVEVFLVVVGVFLFVGCFFFWIFL